MIDPRKIYKNWTVHNLVGHPLMEIIHLISFGKATKISQMLHDATLPEKDYDRS